MIWPFKKRKVTYPFAPLLEAMREKDAALYESVSALPVPAAIKAWRDTYPEDFAPS